MAEKSILLVDDEINILTSIGWALEKHDFKITTVTNGQEAIQQVQKNHYDLVITDLVMPKMDGLEVLKRVKQLSQDIGVIILTGRADIRSAIEALQLGADDYLQKPCDIDDLLSKTHRSFEKQDLVAKLRDRNEKLQTEITARLTIERQLQESRDNLELQVAERTAELTDAVDELQTVLGELIAREEEIQKKNCELQDINTALSVMLKRREQEQHEVRKEISTKAQSLVIPLLKKAENRAKGSTKGYVETARINLLDILSEYSPGTALISAKLAPRELQVIHYLRQDKSSKEIADLLGLSVRTITTYRENIRKKLRITNKKKNLRKFITSIP